MVLQTACPGWWLGNVRVQQCLALSLLSTLIWCTPLAHAGLAVWNAHEGFVSHRGYVACSVNNEGSSFLVEVLTLAFSCGSDGLSFSFGLGQVVHKSCYLEGALHCCLHGHFMRVLWSALHQGLGSIELFFSWDYVKHVVLPWYVTIVALPWRNTFKLWLWRAAMRTLCTSWCFSLTWWVSE